MVQAHVGPQEKNKHLWQDRRGCFLLAQKPFLGAYLITTWQTNTADTLIQTRHKSVMEF